MRLMEGRLFSFRIPDLRGRVIAGVDGMGTQKYESINLSSGVGSNLGQNWRI